MDPKKEFVARISGTFFEEEQAVRVKPHAKNHHEEESGTIVSYDAEKKVYVVDLVICRFCGGGAGQSHSDGCRTMGRYKIRPSLLKADE